MIDRRENRAYDQAGVQRSSQHGAVRQRAPEASALAADDEPGDCGHAPMAPYTHRACAHSYSLGSIAHNSPLHIAFTIGLPSPRIER